MIEQPQDEYFPDQVPLSGETSAETLTAPDITLTDLAAPGRHRWRDERARLRPAQPSPTSLTSLLPLSLLDKEPE